VDGPNGKRLLTEAVAEHRWNIDLAKTIDKLPFAGDKTDNGLSIESVSPFSYRTAIEAGKVPMLIRVGWYDGATVEGALGRFNTFSNTQKLIIGAFSHAGSYDTDPFQPKNAKADPDSTQQMEEVIRFFDCYLKDPTPLPTDPLCSSEKSITYFTMGARRWQSVSQWPLPNTEMRRLYLAPEHMLTSVPNAASGVADLYQVDFSASTGKANRWATQMGGAKVVYNNRIAQDAKLLTYTSTSLASDVEVTGQSVVSIRMMSSQPDGAVHAYLEDVAPDGKVTYLTEGVQRLALRATNQDSPYWQMPPFHRLRRSDYAPMPVGKFTEVSFTMFPVSVLVRAGHRLRLAIAGADADYYQRIPATGEQSFTVATSGDMPSFLDVPIMLQ